MKLKWNMDAFDQIRTDPALREMVDNYCEEIVEECGEGFNYRTGIRKGKRGYRYRGMVHTDNPRAIIVNQRENTLLNALRGVM